MPDFIKTRTRINGDQVVSYPDGRVVIWRGNKKIFEWNRNAN